jgi:hypothetical protein
MHRTSTEARQTIIYDQKISIPGKRFYLVIHHGDGSCDTVWLDGAASMPAARQIALAKGHRPTHHATAGSMVEFAY